MIWRLGYFFSILHSPGVRLHDVPISDLRLRQRLRGLMDVGRLNGIMLTEICSFWNSLNASYAMKYLHARLMLFSRDWQWHVHTSNIPCFVALHSDYSYLLARPSADGSFIFNFFTSCLAHHALK